MFNKIHLPILIIILFVLFTNNTKADRRSYVWNYEYQIMDRGKAELENYMTLSSPDLKEMKGKTTTEMLYEYEIGMTEHFDFAIYQAFLQLPTSSFQYDGYKLRARYKFGEKNSWFVNPLIYFEYSGKPDFSEHELEFKLILSKDFGDFNVTFNPIFEYSKEEKDWETLPGYSLGMKYDLSRLLCFGLEFKGDKNGHYFGPTISHGGEKVWVAFGSMFKISEIKNNQPEILLRLLVGFEL